MRELLLKFLKGEITREQVKTSLTAVQNINQVLPKIVYTPPEYTITLKSTQYSLSEYDVILQRAKPEDLSIPSLIKCRDKFCALGNTTTDTYKLAPLNNIPKLRALSFEENKKIILSPTQNSEIYLEIKSKNGHHIQATIFENYNALGFATAIQNIYLVGCLLEAGANPTYSNHQCDSPTLIAADGLKDSDDPLDKAFLLLKMLLSDSNKVKANINFRAETGENVLFYAAKKGRTDVVTFLLSQKNINANIPSVQNLPPIFVATQYGHHSVVNLLCQVEGIDLKPKQTSITINDQRMMTPVDLFIAAGNHMAVIEILLKHTAPSDLYWEAIFNAQNYEALECLLKNRINPNTTFKARNVEGKVVTITLIQAACMRTSDENRDKMIKLLLEHKANPNVFSENGYSLLYLLTINNLTNVMRTLLENKYTKIDVNQTNNIERKNTSLHGASELGHFEAAKLLLEYKADSTKLDSENVNPLHLVIYKKHLSLIPLFKDVLNKHYDVIYSLSEEKTRQANNRMREVLRNQAHPALVLQTRKETTRSIFVAIYYGDEKVVQCLCDHGAHAKYIKGDHASPLFSAISHQKSDIVKVLLNCGADPNDADDIPGLPFKLAIEDGCIEIVEELLKSPTLALSNPYDCLLTAIEKDYQDILKLLLENRFEPLATFDQFILRSPLFTAIYLNRIEIVDIIVNFLNNNNRTKELKTYIVNCHKVLTLFIENDQNLCNQIFSVLENILLQIKKIRLTTTTENIGTEKFEEKAKEKIEQKIENWSPSLSYSESESTTTSTSSRRYLLEQHGWSHTQIDDVRNELKRNRIKRREIDTDSVQETSEAQKVFTWFDGAIDSSHFIPIERDHGQGNHFLWIPDFETLKCPEDLYNKFTQGDHKFTKKNIRKLTDIKIIRCFQINNKSYRSIATHEKKIHGSLARILLFTFRSDDCSATVYYGGEYLPSGLHNSNNTRDLLSSCTTEKIHNITLPTGNIKSNINEFSG